MWSAVGVVAGFYLLIGSFIIVMRAKAIRDEGAKITLFWRVGVWPWAIIGVALDVAFNVVAGTVMFLELPHEIMFTSRSKRHVREAKGWRLAIALFWQKQLNQISPGHV